MRHEGTWIALVCVLGLALVAPLGPAQAQESAVSGETDRPRVGLVLSGGGAKGAAHVGVIEVLEELDIKVDFIVGTSMGAIVGGLYASGVAPQEMEQQFAAIDWKAAFNDQPVRKRRPFRRKEEDQLPLGGLEFGLGKGGFQLPAGLVAGQKLNFLLRSMLLHATRIRSFDDLPIPFRAIASDLDTAEVVVLDRGDLAKSLRASMAFPLLFTPVELDGRELVDGGVLRNIPIDVALELGADRLIVVDVSAKLQPMPKNPSGLAITRRTVSMTSSQNRDAQLELLRPQDLLIVPDLEGVTFEDFDEMDVAVERGLKAAWEHEDELRTFSVPEPEFQAYLKHQRAGTDVGEVTVDFVEVTGVEKLSPKKVRNQVHTKAGDTLDLEKLAKDLERVYKIGEFETVEFRLEERDGGTGLVIEAREKAWGPWYMRPGISLATDLAGRGGFFVTGLFRRPQINRWGAEWRSVLNLGSANLFFTEFFQPLEPTGRFFAAPVLLKTRDADDKLRIGDTDVNVDTEYLTYGLDFGYLFGNVAQLKVGWRGGEFEGKPEIFLGDERKADLGAFRVVGTGDTLDNVDFPGSGIYGIVDFWGSRESLGADDDFDRLFAEYNQAGSIGRFSLVGTARYGDDLGSDLPFYASYSLGGFLNLSGTAPEAYRGSTLGFARLLGFRRFGKVGGLLGGATHLGISLELGEVWQAGEARSVSDMRPAAALFWGTETLLGPVYLAWGLSDGGENSFYLLIGRAFRRANLRF